MRIAKTIFVTIAAATMVSGLAARAKSAPDASQSMPASTSNVRTNSKPKKLTHKQAREARHQVWIMKHFDTNGDGILDNDEQAAMRAWKEHHRRSLSLHRRDQPADINTQPAGSPATGAPPATPAAN
jgi:hypothetical protein